MNILFLTSVNIDHISERNIYTDLLRKFGLEGHQVFMVSPCERRLNKSTTILQLGRITLLKVKTLNLQKTNFIEKGISTVLLEHQFLSKIQKYFPEVRFDWIIYSTPPITFTKLITYIKSRDKAKSYLLLKDIFPQNAVDLGMIRKGGIIHRYFRRKEQILYEISDFIGCMTPANVEYIINNNPRVNPNKIEVNPNSIEPRYQNISEDEKYLIRRRYGISIDAIAFVYGGNLGKPQGVDFLIKVLDAFLNINTAFFVIVGSGTEFRRIQSWFENNKPKYSILIESLKKEDYDQLVQSCDIGMIFLDKRFTIPNFPSRILSYLEFRLPVLAATDRNTDLGNIITDNDFGLWSESGDLDEIKRNICNFLVNKKLNRDMGLKGFLYFSEHYTVSNSYAVIAKHLEL